MLVGIDIGGTKCAVCCGKYSKSGVEIVDKIKFPTEKGMKPEAVMKLMAENIRKLKIDKIDAIGISCGSPLDSKKGVILSPPNLIGWDNVEIVKYFSHEFGVPTMLQNDANACALAEWQFGAAKGYRNVVFLTFGTGMGAGLILDGRLYTGTNDMAGEVGHVSLARFGPVGYGKSGSFEGFCSGGGIAQLGRIKAIEYLQVGKKTGYCESLSELNSIDAKTIADCAKSGDLASKEVYDLCAEMLGYGLSMIIDIINPEIIVIGSIFERSHKLLWEGAKGVIEQETIPLNRNVCTVVPAELGDSIGDYAALAVAAYAID